MKALFHPVECRCVGGGSLAAALKGIEFSQSLAVAFVFLPLSTRSESSSTGR